MVRTHRQPCVTETSTGRWIPKTLSGITYGTNGFRLILQTLPRVIQITLMILQKQIDATINYGFRQTISYIRN